MYILRLVCYNGITEQVIVIMIKLQISAYDLLISAFIDEDEVYKNGILQGLIERRDELEELAYGLKKLVNTLEYSEELL